jgi:hypothetical protein
MSDNVKTGLAGCGLDSLGTEQQLVAGSLNTALHHRISEREEYTYFLTD